MLRRLPVPLAAIALLVSPVRAAGVPAPESVLGFRPGEDFHLAPWDDVVAYFRAVDEASDRVLVETLGETTEGRPYIVATVSSPETIADLPRYRALQHALADPRIAPEEGVDPVADSKPVVLITGSIHSTETASTLMAAELLHDLADGDDPATREFLDGAILLLVPSANPDGVDKVASWYERSRGKPWEGGGMPLLYHKYAGHDTNRDWFMLNLAETRLLTRLLYEEWFPTIVYDVHQMGTRGARLFVPPFHDPVNPNLDPRLSQAIALIGAHMAMDLAEQGKEGVLTHAMYDNWWNGGNRTTPQRHNMVGVLTEAASVRLASPIFLDRDQLRAGHRGFPDHRPAVNFVDPWPGGWWRLRDIIDYELICARSLLTLAVRYADDFQRDYRAMARDAIEAGRDEPPYAWIVPAGGDDPGRAAAMVATLHATGVEALRATEPFEAGGATFPAGSWVLPASQPYRAHLKDMMERQEYPPRFDAKGRAEPPYDVAGWTLPLLMGVRVAEVAEPLTIPAEPVDVVEPPPSRIEVADRPEYFVLANRSNDDLIVLNALLAAGQEVRVVAGEARLGERELTPGALLVRFGDGARRVLDATLPGVSTLVEAVPGPLMTGSPEAIRPIEPTRVALYQPWVPSMDEGWTRLVLERLAVPYVTWHNDDVRAGALRERADVVVLPSISPDAIREGFEPGATEPAYAGGLGPEGADALRQFVREGGTLVCLENSCAFAIAELDLATEEVLGDLSRSDFYGPGSILRLRYEHGPEDALTLGMPAEGPAYFDRSLAFDVEGDAARVVARYAEVGLLESGWLLGADRLQGKAAIVVERVDQGRVVLFGFPPQHRGQTHATFRLLVNALRLTPAG